MLIELKNIINKIIIENVIVDINNVVNIPNKVIKNKITLKIITTLLTEVESESRELYS